MEPECPEPLNLVMKKDEKDEDGSEAGGIVQESQPVADHKFLQALYMSSLMHMTGATARSATPPPTPPAAAAGVSAPPQNFMHLLAMLEARHRMWQQMSWSIPQSFMRGSLGFPQPYFDGPVVANMSEQLAAQNSIGAYPSASAKRDGAEVEGKQPFSKR